MSNVGSYESLDHLSYTHVPLMPDLYQPYHVLDELYKKEIDAKKIIAERKVRRA